MFRTRNLVVVGVVFALFNAQIIPEQIPVAGGIRLVRMTFAQTSTSWNDLGEGPEWDDDANWSFGEPTSSVNALHETSASDIEVNIFNAGCLSFTGEGALPYDRFMTILGGRTLTVEQDLNNTGGGSRFIVRLQNGSDELRTKLIVKGIDLFNKDDLGGIELMPAIGSGHGADWVTVDVDGYVKDCSMTVGDDARVLVGTPSIDPTDNVTGPGEWRIGDRGFVDIWGGVVGVDMLFGTPAAQTVADATDVSLLHVGRSAPMADTWTLQGYADVEVEACFQACLENAPGTGAQISLRDHAQMAIGFCNTAVAFACDGGQGSVPEGGAVQWSIFNGTWTVADNASLSTAGRVINGYWTVQDAAQLDIGGSITPKALTIDTALVNCGPFGRAIITSDLEFRRGGRLIAPLGGGDHPGIAEGHDVNSTLTYQGQGNIYDVRGPVNMGGTIVGRRGASLAISSEQGLVVSSKLVTTTDPPIAFDAEGVTLEIGPYTFGPILEVFGPDYERYNPDEVLFVDSPCVRRWQKVTFESPQAATLWNQKTSTPITCPGSSCPGDEIPEALYATDLVVTSGSTLDTDNLNVYYTGKFANDGTVLGGGSVTKLVPTLYGDFNGNGDGDETADTARFNLAFCSCIGDANYDILVDATCAGAIDDADRDVYNANWNNPATLNTGPCSISCTP